MASGRAAGRLCYSPVTQETRTRQGLGPDHRMRPTRHGRWVGVLLVTAWSTTGVTEATPRPDYCHPHLSKLATGPPHLRYRLRPESKPDRCEGLYEQPLAAGSAVRIVSFTRRLAEFDPERLSTLVLEWPPLPASGSLGEATEVFIRAQGQKPRVYYRMDTIRPSREMGFHWPTSVMRGSGIARDDIGVVAFTPVTINGRARDVYLPLSVGRSPWLDAGPGYTVGLVPATELDEVFVSVTDVETGNEVHRQAPLGLRYYPAEHAFPVRIPLRALPRAGLYEFKLTVKQKNRGAGHTDFLFFHTASR